ncbi:MAG: hypothetical protein V3V56_05945 [bacterium]
MKRIFSIVLKISLGLFFLIVLGTGFLAAWGAYRIAQHTRNPVVRTYSGKSSLQRRPIILVHGLNRSGRMWTAADDGHGNRIPGASSMVDFLRASGFPNLYVNTFPDTRSTSLFQSAKLLKGWIGAARKRFNAGKVDIVAHSMGALVSRAYIQGLDKDDGDRVHPVDFGGDVSNLIMIAAPHLGSPLADSVPSFLDWYAQRTLSEGGGPDLRRLNLLPAPCGINYHSILISSAPGKRRFRWSFWRLMRFFLALRRPLDGDGTVSLQSQNMEAALRMDHCRRRRLFSHLVKTAPGIRHRDASFSSDVQQIVLKILMGGSATEGSRS